jgi:hypothetical protein
VRKTLFPVVLLVFIVAGCASQSKEIAVSINTAQIVGRAAEAPRRVKVEVTDIRKKVTLELTFGSYSMGWIELRPSALELVRAVVQAKADEVVARQGITDPQTVLCGIRVFDIATPANPFYLDIIAKIEIVLRVRRQERTATASATDRALYPSEELISSVTTEALESLAAETDRALTALFAAR